jgi:putative transposase
MARLALRIEISKKDQKELEKLLSGGVQEARAVLRAMVFLQIARGVPSETLARQVQTSRNI